MKEPVFLNGQFRARTTWWFTKFRNAPNTMCFYTPLVPALHTITPKEEGYYSNSKSLRHEKTDHYFREYPHFNSILPTARDWSLHSYVMGPHEDNNDMEEHIGTLIEHAHKKRKRPIFKLNWGLLRGAWLKEKFGGVHIYLHRNYESIRRSFDSMQVYGWAWRDICMVVGQNHDHPVFRPLANHLGYHPEKIDYASARKTAASFWAQKHMDGDFNMETRFETACFFQELALHHAKNHYADYIVDEIKESTQKDIRELTSVKVDLSSYKHKKPAPRYPVSIGRSIIGPAKRSLDRIMSS